MTLPPTKIFLIGFMGVGKSHWGTRLAKSLGYSYYDLDEEISRSADGMSVRQLFEEKGEAFFRQRESDCLQSLCERPGPAVVACGGGTPCFFSNLERMKAAGCVIWLQATPNELLPRLIAEQEKRPLIRGLDEVALQVYIEQGLSERAPFYQQAHRMVVESTLTESNFLQILLHE